jgi:uncharacterized protein
MGDPDPCPARDSIGPAGEVAGGQGDAGTPPPAFVVDAMLGRLARWLRILGHDTLYDPWADDRSIARTSARENRVVLTRDHGLLARRLVRRGLLVKSDELGAQLRQVLDAFHIPPDPRRLFARCTACNGAVEPAPRDEIEGRVPPFVFRHHERFLRCPDCGRIYWGGTHRDLALRRLERLLGNSLDEPGP